MDLGAWADEGYRLPTQSSEVTEADLAEIERSLEERNK